MRVRAIAGISAAAVAALPGVAAAELPPQPRWTAVKGAKLKPDSRLDDVAAVRGGKAWAVGAQARAIEDPDQGHYALEYFNGRKWKQRKLPSARGLGELTGVSAYGKKNVWVVGFARGPYMARWNGKRWKAYRPYGNSGYRGLDDVAVAKKRTWFVGSNASYKPVVLGWNGKKFIKPKVESVSGHLTAVEARGTRAWAVGTRAVGGNRRPLIMRRSKHDRWKVSPAPAIDGASLESVRQLSKNNVWAVGEVHDRTAGYRPLALHWNGSAWKEVRLPVAKGHLYGLTGDSKGRLWAAGDVDDGKASGTGKALFLRYSGGTWKASYGTSNRPCKNGVAARAVTQVPGSSRVFAVGVAHCSESGDDLVWSR